MNANGIYEGKGRRIFEIANYLLLTVIVGLTLYPVLYVLAASLSSHQYLEQAKVTIIPLGFTIEAYQRVLANPLIGISYLNTVFYTVAGTAISLFLTTLSAYALSRRKFSGKKFFLGIVVFAMLFNGGIIPTFLVVRGLGFYNTIWAILLPAALTSFNLIIMKTFFEQIPYELEESAALDGCNPLQTLFLIFLPLSLPGLMTVGLFYAVSQWNSFFPAMIYLRDRSLMPIQIVLRDIVIQNQTDSFVADLATNQDQVSESIRYATIIVATLPIMIVYPFIQKFFIKGTMIGAVKG